MADNLAKKINVIEGTPPSSMTVGDIYVNKSTGDIFVAGWTKINIKLGNYGRNVANFCPKCGHIFTENDVINIK